jgi:hypothetical protein
MRAYPEMETTRTGAYARKTIRKWLAPDDSQKTKQHRLHSPLSSLRIITQVKHASRTVITKISLYKELSPFFQHLFDFLSSWSFSARVLRQRLQPLPTIGLNLSPAFSSSYSSALLCSVLENLNIESEKKVDESEFYAPACSSRTRNRRLERTGWL